MKNYFVKFLQVYISAKALKDQGKIMFLKQERPEMEDFERKEKLWVVKKNYWD